MRGGRFRIAAGGFGDRGEGRFKVREGDLRIAARGNTRTKFRGGTEILLGVIFPAAGAPNFLFFWIRARRKSADFLFPNRQNGVGI